MNRYFYLFVLAVILGAIGGYFYHEAKDEKTRYERDSCYEYVQEQRTFHNIDNFSDVIEYKTKEVSTILDDADCIYLINEYDGTTGITKHTCYLKR